MRESERKINRMVVVVGGELQEISLKLKGLSSHSGFFVCVLDAFSK